METNLYILLEIEPSGQDSAAIITLAGKKKGEWNKYANHPIKGKMVAQMIVAFNKIIEDVKANPEILKIEADEFYKIQQREKQEQEKAIRNEAQMLVVNGEIEEKALDMLVNKYKQYNKDKILKILGARIKKKKIFNYVDDTIVELETGTMKRLQSELDFLNKKDLYDLLGMKLDKSLTEIMAKVELLQAELQKNTNKTDEGASENKLFGECRVIFKNEESRKSYDKALLNSKFNDIYNKIQPIAKSSKLINADQYKILLEECRKKNIERDKAEYYIYQFCYKEGIVIEEGSSSNLDDSIECRFCMFPNDKDSKNCTSCSMPLAISCPSCSQISKSPKELKCPSCGFSISDMPKALFNFSKIEKALLLNDINGAEKWFVQTEKYWKTYPSLRTIRDRIRTVKDNKVQLDQKAKILRDEKQYIALSNLLNTSNRQGDSYLEGLHQEAQDAILSARRALNTAQSLNDNLQRIDQYMLALHLCADLQEAQKELQLNPPKVPSLFKAIVMGKSIQLSWNKELSKYISYLIIRKKGAKPTSSTDGEVVASLSNSSYDDTKVAVGESYYYAIYSCCGNIHSSTASIIGPVLVTTNIEGSGIAYKVQEKLIEFTFKYPPKTKSLEIYRDNTLLKVLASPNFTDSGLTPEKLYTYKFVCVYEDCLGKTYKSAETILKLKPALPPKPIAIFREDRGADTVLSWTPSPKGSVILFRAESPLPYRVGDSVYLDNIDAVNTMATGTSFHIQKNFTGQYYYMPVVVVDGIGVAGNQIEIKNVAKPQNVQITTTNNQELQVSWNWDKNTKAISLTYQLGNSSNTVIIKQSTTTQPLYRLPIAEGTQSVHISIAGYFKNATGEDMLSEEIEHTLALQALRVDFLSVKNGGLFSKDKYKVMFKSLNPLPCDLEVCVGEGFSSLNMHQVALIRNSSVICGQEQIVDINYSRRDKKSQLMFRIQPADSKYDTEVVVSPSTIKL